MEFIRRYVTSFKEKQIGILNKIVIPLNTATDIVLKCYQEFRLPEPIREAHKLANEIRKNYKKN